MNDNTINPTPPGPGPEDPAGPGVGGVRANPLFRLEKNVCKTLMYFTEQLLECTTNPDGIMCDTPCVVAPFAENPAGSGMGVRTHRSSIIIPHP